MRRSVMLFRDGALVAASLADLDVTLRFLAVEPDAEANPVARVLVKTWGANSLIPYKIVLLVLLLAALHFVASRKPWLSWALWGVCMVVLLTVVVWNWIWLPFLLNY